MVWKIIRITLGDLTGMLLFFSTPCHNVINTRNVFMNKSTGEMISQGRNALSCNLQTNQGPDRLCQVKSHVQTGRESQDLNMDF